MTKAMTALAVVFLMGAAAPALAAPGDQDRAERADGGRTDHDRLQRDGDAGRPRADFSQRGDSGQRDWGQRDGGQRDGGQRDGGGRRDWGGRDRADRPAPAPAVTAPAPQPAQATERRAWDRGDRGDRQGWTRGSGFQDRDGGQRPDDDRRPDNVQRPDSDRRNWDQRRDGDRRDWDQRRDNDRRDWDRRNDGDRRDWNRRDNDRSRWDRHDWNHDWPHWERGRYPTVYFSHSRYRHSWRPPPGFYVRIWSFGDFLPRAWYGPDYWIVDPWAYDLPLPPPGFDWVRIGDDALLVDQFTGRVVQVVRDVFW